MLDLGKLLVQFVPDFDADFITHRKPACLKNVFKLDETCDAAAFFDADIILRAGWSRVEHWISCGIAVCVDGWLRDTPSDHNPLRVEWRKALAAVGRQSRSIHSYFNSGFLGLQRTFGDFLDLWETIIGHITAARTESISQTHINDRTYPFHAVDQDAMNAALMGVDMPISALGPEGMGFSGFGTYMTHFATHPKPWDTHYTSRSLKGYAPSPAERQFWDVMDGPIKPANRLALALHRADLSIAKAVSRFYRRPG